MSASLLWPSRSSLSPDSCHRPSGRQHSSLCDASRRCSELHGACGVRAWLGRGCVREQPLRCQLYGV
eukprot:10739-Chlamydomonas_euryale.AAC.1